MPIVELIVVLIIIGVLIWAAQRIIAVIPIAEPFRTVIYALLVVLAVFLCLDVLGLLPGGWRIGHVCP